eukprot:439596_1
MANVLNNTSLSQRSSLLKKDDKLNESSTCICVTIIQKYFFIIGVLITVIFAASYPSLGCNDCILTPRITSSWITVIFVFFIRGISMKSTAFKKASLFWELNLFVHAFMFICIPLIAYLLSLFLRAHTALSPELIDGLLILSALPTTTVTCIVLTATAEGNEAASIVNATLTNLTGIVISPAVILILLQNAATVDILGTFFELAMKIMLPFFVGQIVRCGVGDLGRKCILDKKQYFKKCIEFGLFYIIFTAISESFYSGFDSDFIDILYVLVIVIILHMMLLIINWYLTYLYSKVMNNELCCCKPFDIYDRIAILFCATQKTVALGLPMIGSMFGTDPNIGLYIIPLLLMHPFQLIFDSLLVQPVSNWRKKKEKLLNINKIKNEKLKEIDEELDEFSSTTVPLSKMDPSINKI